MIYQDEMDSLWGTLKPIPDNQLIRVDDQQTIVVGDLQFKAWYTPGHAKHHIAWQFGKNLFTGDLAGVCINNGPVIPPCPPPDIDIEMWLKSVDLISQLDVDRYYLTHFGPIDNLSDHRNELIHALTRYSEFFLPFFLEGMKVEETLSDFRNFVKDFLVEQGMDPADAAAYEAANPPDMSATGLMRYWRKREEFENKPGTTSEMAS